jgi:hypothetical protein
MKTLDDSLREEFYQILEQDEFKTKIELRQLDIDLIKTSFERLLENKYKNLNEDELNESRQQFQNFIINHFKENI